MQDMFELTEAKKLSTKMILLSVLLFIIFIVLKYIESNYIIPFYEISFILALSSYSATIISPILLITGIALGSVCDNFARRMKLYDEEIYEVLSKKNEI